MGIFLYIYKYMLFNPFELTFLSGVRQGSSFILLHVAIQFPRAINQRNHPLLAPLSILVNIYAQIHFLAPSSIPQVYMSVFMPVPYCFDYHRFVIWFETMKYDTSNFALISWDCLGSFVVPCEFQDSLLCFCKKCRWHIDRNCIDSLDVWGLLRTF